MTESGKYYLLVFPSTLAWHQKPFLLTILITHQYIGMKNLFFSARIMALRKAEKEEEKRAREKIRQKLEEDKV